MKRIDFERWKPSADDPRKLEYDGQRTAEEVFQELKHRLEAMGYLPDEYFLLNMEWENGREIPGGADIFCTTDYGGSEGVYLDVYLKWFDEAQKKPITSRFITGKTLGESGNDLDRMFLISSAITKAFHGGNATHSRFMKTEGIEEDTGGRVVHLSQQEEKVIIEALVEQRERQESAMIQTEQLLRRMTGSITEYVNLVGMRPLRLSDQDKTILAIRDGDLSSFKELYPKALGHADDLLVEAAGRPGEVGRKMTLLLLADAREFSEPAYRTACEKAIRLADQEKTLFLIEQADSHVSELAPSFYGEMAGRAHSESRAISREIIKRCTNEQIAAAPPYLLEMFAADSDAEIMGILVEKGISGGNNAARTLHMLTYEGMGSRLLERLLQKRMWVDLHDYGAFHACVENGAVEVCKRLLDGGMDFNAYQVWAERHQPCSHAETIQALENHWAAIKQEPAAQKAGGMTLG